jgi:hypothetical protein
MKMGLREEPHSILWKLSSPTLGQVASRPDLPDHLMERDLGLEPGWPAATWCTISSRTK